MKKETTEGLALFVVYSFVTFIITILTTISALLVATLIQEEPDKLINIIFVSSTLIDVCIKSLFLFVIYCVYRDKIKYPKDLNITKFIVNTFKYLLLILFVTVFMSISVSILFPSYIGNSGDNQESLITMLSSGPNIFLYFNIIILSPVIEEFIYRYVVISKILRSRSNFVKILVSTLLFSFIHVGLMQATDIGMFLYLMFTYAISSFVLSVIYVRKGYWGSLHYHILNNLIALIPILFI